MVVAGADELSQAMLFMFDSFKSLAPDAIRPFDRDRRGLLLGEGAAALVLERARDARARGAPAHGRVLGCANFADAHHMTAPDPGGRGAVRAMLRALERAGVSPADVDHISAHGTGTPANDAVEASAIRAVFGANGERPTVSALKSILGHTQGAAGAVEAVACLLAIRDSLAPPIANHESADDGCDLDLVVGEARKARVEVALSNAFGFGGNIECAVFGAA
jgi:3-oxoacyl-[acyl-carrier-protein] synthase II